MASRLFTEAWISSADFSSGCQSQDERLAEEIAKKIEASTVSSKLDFFRSMGLEISNCWETNDNDNDKHDDNNNDCDRQSSHKRLCRSSSRTSERIADAFDEIPEKNLDRVSRPKRSDSRNSENCFAIGNRKSIPLLRDCRVTIIGEKCKTCGRCFKCIRDLEFHVKKKHRARRSRKKLVLKIGDEIISRLPIKRKHLKWRHSEKRRTIDSSDDRASNAESLNSPERISDEEVATLVDNDRDRMIDTTPWPRLMDIDDSDITLQSYEDSLNPRKDEEDEIQMLLKITRPRKSVTEEEINHETPNRSERERLLTDAIREFVTMDDDLVEIIEPARDLQVFRDDSEIIEDYGDRQIGNLEGEEQNFSFHIDNQEDFDCGARDVNSLLPAGGNEFFQEDAVSGNSTLYRNENGDIVPDFIDYTHCLNDRPQCLNDRPPCCDINNGCEFDSLFYNETPGNVWEKTTCEASFDVHENANETPESLVLIKEEIMLDELL